MFSPANYSWRGKPILDLDAWCRENQFEMLTVEYTEAFQVPRFPQNKPENARYWFNRTCECCGRGDDESTYHGPYDTKKVTRTERIPAPFYESQRIVSGDGLYGRIVGERVIAREIPA